MVVTGDKDPPTAIEGEDGECIGTAESWVSQMSDLPEACGASVPTTIQ